MPKTVLEVVQDAAREMSLTPPSSAVSSATDLTATQLLALYKATGERLVRRRAWRMLIASGTLTTEVGNTAYDLPADWSRPLTQTEWDTVNRSLLAGPSTPQYWQFVQSSGLVSTMSVPDGTFILIGNQIKLSSTPTDVRDIEYLYISKYWVRSEAGAAKAAVTLDTDYSVFDDRLMTAGVKLRFFQAKGFDTTAFAADFQEALDDVMAQDTGAPILNLSTRARVPLISVANLPDRGYGL